MEIEIHKSEEQEFKNCASENIFAHYKKIFVGEGKSEEQRFKEASAIYAVVYEDSKRKELNRQTLQLSWKVAGSEFCSIYSQKTSEGSMCLAWENLDFFLRQ